MDGLKARRAYGLNAALLFLALTFVVLDRSNVSIIALDLKHKIGLTDELYGFGVAAFFISYLPTQVINTVISERIGGQIWIGISIILIGVITATTYLVTNSHQYIVWRFMLGAFEGGSWTAMVLYASTAFPANVRVRLLSLLSLAVPLMGAFGSIISSQLLQMNGLMGLAGWQWVFILEGVPAIFVGLSILCMLKPSIDAKAGHADASSETAQPSNRRDSLLAFALLSIVGVGYNAATYMIIFWTPKILSQSGASIKLVGALSALPHVAGFLSLALWNAISRDRLLGLRALIIPLLIATLALGGAALTVPLLWPTLFLLMIAAAALYAVIPIFWYFAPLLVFGRGRAVKAGAINAISSLPGVAIPPVVGLMLKADSSYLWPLITVALLPFVSLIAGLLLGPHIQRRTSEISALSVDRSSPLRTGN